MDETISTSIIPSSSSLLKYGNPYIVSKKDDKARKPEKVNILQLISIIISVKLKINFDNYIFVVYNFNHRCEIRFNTRY